ncbi:MAG: peptide ABC transporter substrate-binding protein [Candidatus Sumerlaeota bacterium]|nr:peptide ABC transporter substrate-binding protein [Candidatus Sumerlaeota bacterium]
MKRVGWMLIAVAAALATACGQGAPETSRNTIIYNAGAEPETLDPAMMTGLIEFRVVKSLLDGLTRLDAQGQPVPALAERWEANADFTIFTFHLRDAKWSNGEPVRAEDFVWNWRRAINPATAAEYAYQLYCVAGAEDLNSSKTLDFSTLGARALDGRTLEVRLVGPTPFFPAVAALPLYYPLPRSAVEGKPDWYLHPETYVGNGPFRLTQWSHNERIVVDRNPQYWNAPAVKLDRVVYRMIEAESTALAAFESGELDVMATVPRPDIPRLRGRPEFHTSPELGTYYVNFNCTRAPFDNTLVRKAFALAIDRQTIVDKVTMGGETPALAWVPPSMPDPAGGGFFRAAKETYFKDHDVEGARKALAEAGYPGGQGFPKVAYIYNTQENHKAIAETFQQMWSGALGVEVALENMDWKVYLERLHNADYDLGRGGWTGDFTDPINFLDIFLSASGNNNPHWKNALYDQLLASVKRTGDQAERSRLMHQAEDALFTEFPLGPIYYYTNPYLEKTRVHGILRNPVGWLDFTEAWVDEGK